MESLLLKFLSMKVQGHRKRFTTMTPARQEGKKLAVREAFDQPAAQTVEVVLLIFGVK